MFATARAKARIKAPPKEAATEIDPLFRRYQRHSAAGAAHHANPRAVRALVAGQLGAGERQPGRGIRGRPGSDACEVRPALRCRSAEGPQVRELPQLPIRQFLVQPYRPFYRVDSARKIIWIVEMWHGAQDIHAPELPAP